MPVADPCESAFRTWFTAEMVCISPGPRYNHRRRKEAGKERDVNLARRPPWEGPRTDDCSTSCGSLYWGVFLTAASPGTGPTRRRAGQDWPRLIQQGETMA